MSNIDYYKLSSSFYITLKAQVDGDETVTNKDLDDLIRNLDFEIEKVCEEKRPVSKKIREEYGERFYRKNFITDKKIREHVIEVADRINKCRKLLIWKNYSKEELYEFIHKTLYIIYKFEHEKLGGRQSEILIDDELKTPEKIKYFEEVI